MRNKQQNQPGRHIIRCTVLATGAAGLLLLSGCTSQRENIPVWLLQPQEEYPAESYLVSIGEGDSRRAAENSAAAGLARRFKTEIQSVETLSETTTETRGKNESFDQFSELQSHVQIGAKQELLNVQFGTAYTDTRNRVYVAAFIPRAETALIYREKILDRGRQIVFLTGQSDAESDPVVSCALRRTAMRNALENDLLLDQLRIIHPQVHAGLTLPYDPQTLYTETAAALRAVTFAVDLSGAAGAVLRVALTSMGFTENARSPDLRFSGTSSFKKADIRRGELVFVRYSVAVEMRDRSGELLLSFSDTAREGHISEEEARARAERSLRQNLSGQIRRELGAFLDRLASGAADRGAGTVFF
jgi:hypothetical protein